MSPAREEALTAWINDLIRYRDLLEQIVEVINDWGSIDKDSLIELVGESDRLTAEDMPEDSWLAKGVAEYQAKIAARYAR